MPQGPPPTTPLVAFADESFREDSTQGCYVLAASVLDHSAQEPAREVMRRLLGSRRTAKLHWHEMDRLQQKNAAHHVASITGLHVVALGTPVPRRRQERARAACLTALVSALHGFGVRHLLMEARAPELNRRDIATVQGARFALPPGSNFWVDHVSGSAEPLLWVADIVAGTVRASHQDSSVQLELLGEHVHLVRVPTGC